MANQLTVFDATKALQYVEQAKALLAKAKDVGEVKAIHDNAEALKAAARKLKDKTAEAAAHEIRKRAERALGQLIKAQKKTHGLNKGGRPSKKTGIPKNPVSKPATLAETGVGKNLASRARTEAAKSPEQFERDLAADKERTAAPKPKLVSGKKKQSEKSRKFTDELEQIVKARKESEKWLAEFKTACDHWLPRLNADDLKEAGEYFTRCINHWAKSHGARPTGSAEQTVEERRAAMAKLAEGDAR
jgi:hypothetical protein